MSERTTGKLRRELMEAMEAVKDGTMQPKTALSLAKLAAQVNTSLLVEERLKRLAFELGKDSPHVGSLNLE